MKFAIYAALATCFATSACGQAQCGDRTAIVDALTDKWGESVQSMGLLENGTVLEVWANIDTGTWTVVGTGPDGVACLFTSGTAFERVDGDAEPTGLKL